MTGRASGRRVCAGKAAQAKPSASALMSAFLAVEAERRSRSIDIVEALTGRRSPDHVALPADETRHFPEDDVLDPGTGAQYFLHRHAAAGSPPSLHVHFFQRWNPPELGLSADERISTHLAALELDASGEPQAWFAVNQWVVGDYWRPAEETVRLFASWRIVSAGAGRGDAIPSLCHRWMSAYVQLSLWSVVFPLLQERDRCLDRLVDAHPGHNVLEDRVHEILAVRPVDFRRQLAGWENLSGWRGDARRRH